MTKRRVACTNALGEDTGDVLFHDGMPAVRVVRREPGIFDLFHYCDLADSAGEEYFADDGPYMSQEVVHDALLRAGAKYVGILGRWYGDNP